MRKLWEKVRGDQLLIATPLMMENRGTGLIWKPDGTRNYQLANGSLGDGLIKTIERVKDKRDGRFTRKEMNKGSGGEGASERVDDREVERNPFFRHQHES